MQLTAPVNHGDELRRFKIPSGFTLIIDSREQHPLYTPNEIEGLEVITDTLTHGDYSVKGFTDRFTIERKTLSDFYTYIGKERNNTTRKMECFQEMITNGGWVGLVIEAEERDLLTGFFLSRVPPSVARAALISFEMRYGVHIYYSRSRLDIARWVLDRSIKFYKLQREVSS